MQPDNNGPFAAIANGFAAALGNALGKVAIFILSVLAVSPAIASMLLLWAGSRWPSFGRSIVGNCIAGVVVTMLTGATLIGIYRLAAGNDTDIFYELLPFGTLAVILFALGLQIRERATFSTARAAGIACAVLVPTVVILTPK